MKFGAEYSQMSNQEMETSLPSSLLTKKKKREREMKTQRVTEINNPIENSQKSSILQ